MSQLHISFSIPVCNEWVLENLRGEGEAAGFYSSMEGKEDEDEEEDEEEITCEHVRELDTFHDAFQNRKQRESLFT